ncbi:MAG: ATP-dependent protease ATPase subunit HslU [Armatimonadetes bacterium]|nr:ATP-dependent protease ATPase subunit HslU [Armatimonadota bacterium]
MHAPLEELTPRQIVELLDKYIVGQNAAKKAVAVALRNRYRRQQLPLNQRDDIMPKNILMMGPTGVGKTEIARRLAQLARAPFIKVEATKFTEVGYVGRDVDAMIRDLAAAAARLVEMEHLESNRLAALDGATYKLADLLSERAGVPEANESWSFEEEVYKSPTPEEQAAADEGRAKLVEEIKSGKWDNDLIEVEYEEKSSPFLQVFGPQGMEEMGLDMSALNNPFQSKTMHRRMKVGDAREFLAEQESKNSMDQASLHQEAVHRAEQTGIIFIDEIDKVAGKSGGSGPDVSREGVQRDLLPVIEGSTVQTKFGPVRTDHILFICAGAFHISKPSDLIPELQGRLPIRVELDSLGEDDFRRILSEPKNALTKQYQQLLGVDGVDITFTDSGLDEIAHFAAEVNAKIENIGARRLHTLMEKLLEDHLFAAPDCGPLKLTFGPAEVREKLGELIKDIEKNERLL